MSTPTPILLLKTPTQPTDPYFTHFSARNYSPRFVSPLTHTLRPPSLTLLLPTPKYGALIFTSARAVEAFALTLSRCTADEIAALAGISLPIYVVGPATERAVRDVQRKWLTGCEVLGAECGNGEALAGFIRRDYKGGGTVGFMVGEMRRDVVPKTLRGEPQEGRVAVEEVVVYETGVRREFGWEFEGVVREEGKGGWVVVFSPQGGEEVLKGLGWLDGEGRLRKRWESGRIWWVASIGPTTREYLNETYGFCVDVCAEKPSPEGVQLGIERFVRDRDVRRGSR